MPWLRSLVRRFVNRQQAADPEAGTLLAAARLKAEIHQKTSALQELYTGPKGGVYKIDASGRKRYIKSES